MYDFLIETFVLKPIRKLKPGWTVEIEEDWKPMSETDDVIDVGDVNPTLFFHNDLHDTELEWTSIEYDENNLVFNGSVESTIMIDCPECSAKGSLAISGNGIMAQLGSITCSCGHAFLAGAELLTNGYEAAVEVQEEVAPVINRLEQEKGPRFLDLD